MRGREVLDRFLVLLLVDRRGNHEGFKRIEIQMGLRAVIELDHMPAIADVLCCPFANLTRLALGRSICDQDIHRILRRQSIRSAEACRRWLQPLHR